MGHMGLKERFHFVLIRMGKIIAFLYAKERVPVERGTLMWDEGRIAGVISLSW